MNPSDPIPPGDECLILRPESGWALPDWKELWRHRELLSFLVWRDLKVRYKQTVLGMGWAVIQPLLTMLAFSLVFGRLAGMPSQGVPYPLFAMTGLVAWFYFANAVASSGMSLVDHRSLLTKVYFPRQLLPLAGVISGLADFLVSLLALLPLLLFYRTAPSCNLWALPLLVGWMAAAALGVSLWLSALNAMFRDVRYAVGFLIQFGLFATPVVYPTALLAEPLRAICGLNPMCGVVEGLRWALLGTPLPQASMLTASALSTCALLAGGTLFFRRAERLILDVL